MGRALGILMLIAGLALLGLAGWFLSSEGEDRSAPRAPADPLAESGADSTEPSRKPRAITTESFRPAETAMDHEGLQIVDPRGAPIAGAFVAVMAPHWRVAHAPVLTAADMREDAVAWRRSDAQGIVETAGLDETKHLVVEHEGAAGWIRVAEVVAAPATRLKLRHHTTLVVRVVCEGEPQPDYRVMMLAGLREGPQDSRHGWLIRQWMVALERDGLSSSWPSAVRTGMTDASGVARIPIDPLDVALSRAMSYRLAVQGVRSVEQGVDWQPGLQIETQLEVPPARALRLRLVGADGRLRAIDWPLLLEWSIDPEPGGSIIRDALMLREGRCWWRPRPTPRRVRVFAALGLWPVGGQADLALDVARGPALEAWLGVAGTRGFLPPTASGPEVFLPWHAAGRADPEALWQVVRPGDSRTVDVTLEAPPIARLPLWLHDGTPLDGRNVIIHENGAKSEVSLWPGSELRFAAGVRRRFVVAPAHAKHQPFLPIEVDVAAQLQDGKLDPLRLPDLHHYVWGRVVGPDGRAIHDAEVQVLGPGGTRTVRTGPDGRYLVRGRERATGKLRVGARAGEWRRSPWIDVPAESAAPDLVLPDTGGLGLSVKAPEAAPPITVRIVHHDLGEVKHPLDGRRATVAGLRMQTGPLPVGMVDVTLSMPGAAEIRVADVSVLLGKTHHDPRLQRLEMAPALQEISFEVQSHDGRPARGAFAILGVHDEASGRTQLLEQEVDAKGHVAFQLPPGGSTVLVIEGHGGAQHLVTRPRDGQTVVLSRPCALSLLSPEEIPAGVTLCLHPPAGEIPEGLQEVLVPIELVPGSRARVRDPVAVRPGRYRAELLHRRPSGGERRLPLGTLTVPRLAEASLVLPGEREAVTRWLAAVR